MSKRKSFQDDINERRKRRRMGENGDDSDDVVDLSQNPDFFSEEVNSFTALS